MISGYLVGDRELVARLKSFPAKAKADVDTTVQRLGFELQANVQRDYLTGQVLKVQTGRLRNSIAQGQPDSRSRFESTPVKAIAYVGTNVSYGRTWEYDGIPEHDVVPVRAKALRFEVGGQVLFRKKVHIKGQPARPFLQPALQAFKPHATEELRNSLKRTAQEVFA